jgi:hypothetical protein
MALPSTDSQLTQSKIKNQVSSLAVTRQTYKSLSNTYWSSKYMTAPMTTLLESFGNCLNAFDSTERTITIPTFIDIHQDLISLSSMTGVPSYDVVRKLLSSLERNSSKLNQAVKKHTATLASLKSLEHDCQKAQASLESKAAQLKETGKDKKAAGVGIGILGVLFAPVTFGVSLAAIPAAGGLYASGDHAMEKYRTLKSETTTTFTSLSNSLKGSVEIISLFAGLITTLSKDVKELSESRSQIRLLVARSKAGDLCTTFDLYLNLAGVATEKRIRQ